MKCALKMALAISYQINTHEMVGTICLLMDEFQISARQFTINEKFSLGQRSQLRQKLEAPTSLLIIVFGNYMLANINLIVFYFFIKVLNDRACVYIIRTKTITPSNSWAVDKNECCGYFFSIWVLKKTRTVGALWAPCSFVWKTTLFTDKKNVSTRFVIHSYKAS